MTHTVFGLSNNDEQARLIVDHLLSAGFSNEDISILYPDKSKNSIENYEREHMAHDEHGSRYEREDIAYDEHSSHHERGDRAYDEHSRQKNDKRGDAHIEESSKASEGGMTGAATGGILGGSLGLLAGLGALAIPGLGPFIAAGPIMAALSGSAVGGGVGLLIGTLIGAGIPEYEAKRYEAGLKEGNILISVVAENEEEINRAKEIMKKEGATDISSTREKTKSKY